MTSTLKLLLVISLVTKISGVTECKYFIAPESMEEDYKVKSISHPWDLDTNTIRVKIGIDPDEFKDKTKPGSLELYYSKNESIRDIINEGAVKYKLRLPNIHAIILSIDYNDKRFCETKNEPSMFLTSIMVMDYNITLKRSPYELLTSGETIYFENKHSSQGRVLGSSGVNKKQQYLETYKFHEQCGKRDHIVVPTIIGGREVQPNEFPWLVALFNNKREYFCAGTLITDKHVISAAHCTLGNRVVYMEFAKHFLDKRIEAGGLVAVSKQIINHPEYLANTGHADISIIVTENPIKFNDKIWPICLWHFTDDAIGQTGTVAGWGADQSGFGTNEPRAAQIDIVSNEECKNSNRLFRNITSDATFCAGANRKGSCNGDSGAGFLLLKDNRWYLKGIVSVSLSLNGFSCDVNQFSVFCDIGQNLEWIKMNIV